MLRVLGSPRSFCDGCDPAGVPPGGGVGAFGLGLGDWLRRGNHASNARMPASFGKAKSCILLYLYGSPSQLETFDPKPDAPAEIRGELGSIPTACPVPRRRAAARHRQRHGPGHRRALDDAPVPDPRRRLRDHRHARIPRRPGGAPARPGHWPFIGSVVDYLEERRPRAGRRRCPATSPCPCRSAPAAADQPHRAGPYAGFLGAAYDPVWTEFHGKGTGRVVKTLRGRRSGRARALRAASRRTAGSSSPPAASSPPDLTLDRLDRRRSLLEQFDQARRDLDAGDAGRGHRPPPRRWPTRCSAPTGCAQALDLGREPRRVRESYGMTLFGQAALTARRLVEAGGRFVSVFWDEYGLAGIGLGHALGPLPPHEERAAAGFDRGLSGLLTDLDARGLLDETLVLLPQRARPDAAS